jgi:hypothetical protein
VANHIYTSLLQDSKSGPPTPKQQPNSRRNSPPPSLFFEDAEPGTVDAALRFPVPIPSTSAEIDYTSEPKETLLLPDHVRLVQEGDVSSQPPVNGSTLAEGLHDGVSGSPPSDTSAIEYLDEHPKPFVSKNSYTFLRHPLTLGDPIGHWSLFRRRGKGR